MAAILLLGKDETIRSVLPHYKINALVRRVQMDHYDDRDRIDGNLIEAYYTPGGIPEYRDGPVFTTIVPVKTNGASDTVAEQDGRSSVKTSVKKTEMMRNDPEISARQISEVLGITIRAVEMQTSKLQEKGKIKRIGSAKGGHWEVISDYK